MALGFGLCCCPTDALWYGVWGPRAFSDVTALAAINVLAGTAPGYGTATAIREGTMTAGAATAGGVPHSVLSTWINEAVCQDVPASPLFTCATAFEPGSVAAVGHGHTWRYLNAVRVPVDRSAGPWRNCYRLVRCQWQTPATCSGSSVGTVSDNWFGAGDKTAGVGTGVVESHYVYDWSGSDWEFQRPWSTTRDWRSFADVGSFLQFPFGGGGDGDDALDHWGCLGCWGVRHGRLIVPGEPAAFPALRTHHGAAAGATVTLDVSDGGSIEVELTQQPVAIPAAGFETWTYRRDDVVDAKRTRRRQLELRYSVIQDEPFWAAYTDTIRRTNGSVINPYVYGGRSVWCPDTGRWSIGTGEYARFALCGSTATLPPTSDGEIAGGWQNVLGCGDGWFVDPDQDVFGGGGALLGRYYYGQPGYAAADFEEGLWDLTVEPGTAASGKLARVRTLELT